MIDIASATTPPSFEGIDRKIAYANRKYHSGWMWIGVTMGFAGFKFSTSPRMSGFFVIINSIMRLVHAIGAMSFAMNIG